MNVLASWFEELEGRGEDVAIAVGRATTGETEWEMLSHVDFDGVGALAEVISRRIGKPIPVPVRSARDPGRALCGVGPALELAARSLGVRPIGGALTPPQVQWWSADELVALRSLAAASQSSIGMCLLWALHEALIEETGRPDLDRGVWMTTLNLRRNPTPPHYQGNQAAFVMGDPALGSIEALHLDIKRRLAQGEHWASTAWLAKALQTGPGGVASGFAIADVARAGFLGQFSNMGDWVVPELEGERWCITAPATTLTPLSAAALCLNGTLGIAAKSVVFDPVTLRRILDRCRSIALAEVSTISLAR